MTTKFGGTASKDIEELMHIIRDIPEDHAYWASVLYILQLRLNEALEYDSKKTR